jgi:hypothetical protein
VVQQQQDLLRKLEQMQRQEADKSLLLTKNRESEGLVTMPLDMSTYKWVGNRLVKQYPGMDGVVEDFGTMLKNLIDSLFGKKPAEKPIITTKPLEPPPKPSLPSLPSTDYGGGGGGGAPAYPPYQPPPTLPPAYQPPPSAFVAKQPVAVIQPAVALQLQQTPMTAPVFATSPGQPRVAPGITVTGGRGIPEMKTYTEPSTPSSEEPPPPPPDMSQQFSMSAKPKPKYECKTHNKTFTTEADYNKHMADPTLHQIGRAHV